MDPEALIMAGGVFAVVLAVFHAFFWKLFRWKEELPKLTSLNSAVMQLLNICLTFVFVIFAYLSLVFPGDLLGGEMGRSLVFLIAVLWYMRALLQIVYFGFRSGRSIAFFLLFCVGGSLYAVPLF